jgi:hypothetical protein
MAAIILNEDGTMDVPIREGPPTAGYDPPYEETAQASPEYVELQTRLLEGEVERAAERAAAAGKKNGQKFGGMAAIGLGVGVLVIFSLLLTRKQ